MKKLLALVLAGIMVFAFAGCNIEDIEAGPNSTDRLNKDAVEKINMIYGDDEVTITLRKPDGASFMVDPEEALNAGDAVTMIADDYSWDAEIMGYKYYEAIGSNVPFVDYYYAGGVNEEEYAAYEETITDLGTSFEGKPIKLIRYTFKEVGDEEEYKECFVGFEYKGTEDKGLFGLKIGAFDEELSDSDIRALFEQMIASER